MTHLQIFRKGMKKKMWQIDPAKRSDELGKTVFCQTKLLYSDGSLNKKMKAAILIFICGLFGCGFGQDEEDDMDYLKDAVDTPSGKIIGIPQIFFNRRAKAFLGIPYAKPPIGELRFKKPQKFEPKDGPIWANNTLGSACVQYSEPQFPWYDAKDEGKGEDCLYLNIWSPVAPSRLRLPVIFYIYGGGFTVGSNRIMSQNGLGLSIMGSSIVVAPNYRMGPFGFLSDGTDDAPGNVGIYDLIMALQWVQDNIAEFGGDTNRITLMGQGTGSAIVSLFLLSPLTQGLFTRAIMQSGSFLVLPEKPRERNIQLTRRLAEAVDCPVKNGTLDCLRGVEADRLAKIHNSFYPLLPVGFIPQYGDEFLPNDPVEDLKAGNFRPVPLLIGATKDEGSLLLTTRYPDDFGVFGEMDPTVDKEKGTTILKDAFSHLPDINPETVARQYLEQVDDEDYYKIRKQVYTALGDYNITCPVVYFAEEYSKGNGTVQFYVFSQKSKHSIWARWMGAVHYDEVPFVFARPLEGLTYKTFVEEYDPFLAISYAMAQIWSDFAKRGSGFQGWKNYTSTHHKYVRIHYKLQKKMHGPGPNLDNCNIFREHYGF